MYAVIQGECQVATLTWEAGNPKSFFTAFRGVMDFVFEELQEEFDLAELAVDLYSRYYSVIESDKFNLRFVRLIEN